MDLVIFLIFRVVHKTGMNPLHEMRLRGEVAGDEGGMTPDPMFVGKARLPQMTGGFDVGGE